MANTSVGQTTAKENIYGNGTNNKITEELDYTYNSNKSVADLKTYTYRSSTYGLFKANESDQTYDTSGNVVDAKDYIANLSSNGTLLGYYLTDETKSTYKNGIISSKEVDYYSNIAINSYISSKSFYTYDKNGNITEEKNYTNNTLTTDSTYTYNNGKLVNKSVNNNGVITNYTYSSNGSYTTDKLIYGYITTNPYINLPNSINFYNGTTSLKVVDETKSTYNTNGKLTDQKNYQTSYSNTGSTLSLVGETEYTYNSSGNVTDEQVYKPVTTYPNSSTPYNSGITSLKLSDETKYTYNTNGKITDQKDYSTSYNSAGAPSVSLVGETTWTYGNNSETVVFGKDVSNIAIFEDNSNNLTVNFTSLEGQQQFTINNVSGSNAINTKIQLSNGEYINTANINKIIQTMNTYAYSHGVAFNSVSDVTNNQSLMNLVVSSWHY